MAAYGGRVVAFCFQPDGCCGPVAAGGEQVDVPVRAGPRQDRTAAMAAYGGRVVAFCFQPGGGCGPVPGGGEHNYMAALCRAPPSVAAPPLRRAPTATA